MAKKFSVIDCETDPFRHGRVPEPFVWGCFDERGFNTFERTSDLISYVHSDDRIFYAHNGGRFDFHYLVNWLNTQSEITSIHGRIAKAKIGRAELRDSFCIFPDKLDNIIGGQKIAMDYTKLERPFRNSNWKEIIKYLEGDVYHLWFQIEKFREAHGNTLTLAGAAMNFWARNFNAGVKPKMGSREAQQRYYEQWSQWYFGGRVECFEPGFRSKPVNTYDINSAYPAAMMVEHPAGPWAEASTETGDIERKLFKIDAVSEGFFAIRKKKGGIHFPADGLVRTFNVTGWEFKAALELNARIQKVHEIWEFPGRREFSGYVNHFWKQKQAAEKGSFERLEAKLFLNSLYGKFSSNPENYSRTFLCELDYANEFANEIDGTITGTIGNKRLIEAPLLDEQIRYYDVVTGLSITGFVRAKLMKAIHLNSAFYADTDNIHMDGSRKFIGDLGTGLGQFQPEFQAIMAAYCGPKSYALKDKEGFVKFAAKGVALPRGEEFDILKKIAMGKTFRSHKEAPTFSLKKGASFISRNIRATGKQRA